MAGVVAKKGKAQADKFNRLGGAKKEGVKA